LTLVLENIKVEYINDEREPMADREAIQISAGRSAKNAIQKHARFADGLHMTGARKIMGQWCVEFLQYKNK